MNEHKQLSTNFNSKEFDSPDLEFSGRKMHPSLITKLQELRDFLGQPIIINSGYRTYKQNLKVGGSVNSSHMSGLAVDIHVPNDTYRFYILRLAPIVGFNRIGIGKNFIHLDCDYSKKLFVAWVYKQKN